MRVKIEIDDGLSGPETPPTPPGAPRRVELLTSPRAEGGQVIDAGAAPAGPSAPEALGPAAEPARALGGAPDAIDAGAAPGPSGQDAPLTAAPGPRPAESPPTGEARANAIDAGAAPWIAPPTGFPS